MLSVLPISVVGEWSLPVLILTFAFSLPCSAEEGSERVAVVGTCCLAMVNPLQLMKFGNWEEHTAWKQMGVLLKISGFFLFTKKYFLNLSHLCTWTSKYFCLDIITSTQSLQRRETALPVFMTRFKEKNVGISLTTGLITLPSPRSHWAYEGLLTCCPQRAQRLLPRGRKGLFSVVYILWSLKSTLGDFKGIQTQIL